MNGFEEKLIKYIDNTLSYKNAAEETKKNWAFGAIDFAYSADLITSGKASELYQKYDLT